MSHYICLLKTRMLFAGSKKTTTSCDAFPLKKVISCSSVKYYSKYGSGFEIVRALPIPLHATTRYADSAIYCKDSFYITDSNGVRKAVCNKVAASEGEVSGLNFAVICLLSTIGALI